MVSLESKKEILLGILGNPLGHTISPLLHRVAGEQFGFRINYFPFEVQKDDLGDAVRGLQVLGFTGCNVTIPYKEEIIKFANQKSEVVSFLGAANTLSFRDKIVIADNTDWEGFLRAWKESDMGDIEGKFAVILGAGGAADGILYALAESNIKSFAVFNRDKDRATKLVEKFTRKYPQIAGNAFSLSNKAKLSSLLKNADILINATPLGMKPHIDEAPIKIPKEINPDLRFCDLIYNPPKTRLLMELEKEGIKCCGGLGMLVHQAALSFRRWFGLEPDTGKMLEEALKFFEAS